MVGQHLNDCGSMTQVITTYLRMRDYSCINAPLYFPLKCALHR
jgi:hypothetical protein